MKWLLSCSLDRKQNAKNETRDMTPIKGSNMDIDMEIKVM